MGCHAAYCQHYLDRRRHQEILALVLSDDTRAPEYVYIQVCQGLCLFCSGIDPSNDAHCSLERLAYEITDQSVIAAIEVAKARVNEIADDVTAQLELAGGPPIRPSRNQPQDPPQPP